MAQYREHAVKVTAIEGAEINAPLNQWVLNKIDVSKFTQQALSRHYKAINFLAEFYITQQPVCK